MFVNCRYYAAAPNYSAIHVPNTGMLTADPGQAIPAEQSDQSLHILPFDISL